jgi:pyrroline-5-carboxylate reductase
LKVGFIGCGKMATALIDGVLKAGLFSAGSILVHDAIVEAAESLSKRTGVTIAPSNRDLGKSADVLLLCVKPTDARKALAELETRGKLIISIVAGLPLKSLENAAPGNRFIRVMPNTPALIHQGAAAYAGGENASEADSALAEKFFKAVGKVFRVDESLLDAVTGLSGSGPAYIYLVIEALADAGARMGLPPDLSLQLAAQTAAGAAQMVIETGESPAKLRENVTSPGGTTLAGLKALENCSIRAAFLDAVRAATERSRELGASN